MNKLLLSTLAASLVCAPAYAKDHSRDRERHWQDDDIEYAKVVSARPIYQQVQVSAPRQECIEERVVTREPAYRGHNNGAALLGAILGGVAGHQFGKGRGNSVATAAGAVIGAGIGQSHQGGGGYREQVSYEPRCNTYSDTRYESRLDGYDVTYRYNGRLYHTRMPYDPGSRVPVNVSVNPVQDHYDYRDY